MIPKEIIERNTVRACITKKLCILKFLMFKS